ncbi:MAG: PilZ domain-containing protein, partial [bacterium]
MDYRQSPRHSTVFHSEISNADTHEVIGHQLNISEHGLCMLTHSPYAEDEVLRLELKLPSPCGEASTVFFEAVVCWCGV